MDGFGEVSLKDVTSAVKQVDGSLLITYTGGTHQIPADICDNSGGVDAYVAHTGNGGTVSALYAWLKKFWGKG